MVDVQRTAMRMMRSSGFSNVTVEQIAEAAGVSSSTVYRYFGTKEALVLWGDSAGELVARFAEANVGKKRTVEQALAEAAIDVYGADEKNLLAQLTLVFGNADLAVAFEHGLMSQRNALAEVVATHRESKSGAREAALSAAMLGVLISVLDRWQATGGEKSLTKQIAKAYDQLFVSSTRAE
jgi:AcrR family transcriptional regulator